MLFRSVRTRKNELEDKNIVGAQITKIRAIMGLKQKDFVALLQVSGVDINPTSVSKLEGQTRQVIDKKILLISKFLYVPISDLFPDFNVTK